MTLRIYPTTGAALEAARVALGLTQVEMARRLGCTQPTISGAINGSPRPETVARYLATLHPDEPAQVTEGEGGVLLTTPDGWSDWPPIARAEEAAAARLEVGAMDAQALAVALCRPPEERILLALAEEPMDMEAIRGIIHEASDAANRASSVVESRAARWLVEATGAGVVTVDGNEAGLIHATEVGRVMAHRLAALLAADLYTIEQLPAAEAAQVLGQPRSNVYNLRRNLKDAGLLEG